MGLIKICVWCCFDGKGGNRMIHFTEHDVCTCTCSFIVTIIFNPECNGIQNPNSSSDNCYLMSQNFYFVYTTQTNHILYNGNFDYVFKLVFAHYCHGYWFSKLKIVHWFKNTHMPIMWVFRLPNFCPTKWDLFLPNYPLYIIHYRLVSANFLIGCSSWYW